MNKIFVTQPYLPPKKDFLIQIERIFQSTQLTNQGPLLKELEEKIKSFLKVKNFQYVTNGTIALQLALDALDIKDGEVITTPFSYVATISSILWQRCKPVFVDIEPNNYTLDPSKIEAAITKRTRAIMPVHVFGYACDIERIEDLATKYSLKVIYDAAHAFASIYKGRALCGYGDIATLSFHATKLYHTVEGGGCIINNDNVNTKLDLIKRFGHNGNTHLCLGINGKQSEFHAAMGLSILPHLDEIISLRKSISDEYDYLLANSLGRPLKQKDLQYNYAYYPVLFKDESQLLRVFSALEKEDIYPRRYFYPSLNTLPYLNEKVSCPISENISNRIACLPLYPSLQRETVFRIVKIILENL